MPEATFCMVKPDGVARGLSSEIIKRVSNSGLKVIESRYERMPLGDARRLYKVHEGKSFYEGLVKFITGGDVLLMKLEGDNAVAALRGIMGATDPREAEKGTIRGDLKEENIFNQDKIMKNIIHGSDSRENADYELSIFF